MKSHFLEYLHHYYTDLDVAKIEKQDPRIKSFKLLEDNKSEFAEGNFSKLTRLLNDFPLVLGPKDAEISAVNPMIIGGLVRDLEDLIRYPSLLKFLSESKESIPFHIENKMAEFVKGLVSYACTELLDKKGNLKIEIAGYLRLRDFTLQKALIPHLMNSFVQQIIIPCIMNEWMEQNADHILFPLSRLLGLITLKFNHDPLIIEEAMINHLIRSNGLGQACAFDLDISSDMSLWELVDQCHLVHEVKNALVKSFLKKILQEVIELHPHMQTIKSTCRHYKIEWEMMFAKRDEKLIPFESFRTTGTIYRQKPDRLKFSEWINAIINTRIIHNILEEFDRLTKPTRKERAFRQKIFQTQFDMAQIKKDNHEFLLDMLGHATERFFDLLTRECIELQVFTQGYRVKAETLSQMAEYINGVYGKRPNTSLFIWKKHPELDFIFSGPSKVTPHASHQLHFYVYDRGYVVLAQKPRFYTFDQRSIIAAAQTADMTLMRRLLNARLNPNIQNETKQTALICAANKGHSKIIELLIKNIKTNLNHKDDQGETALMIAAKKGHIEIVSQLVKADCTVGESKRRMDPDIQNKKGETALLLSVKEKHFEITKILMERSLANIHLANEEGVTALQIARIHNDPRILNLLAPPVTGSLASESKDERLDSSARIAPAKSAAIVSVTGASTESTSSSSLSALSLLRRVPEDELAFLANVGGAEISRRPSD